MNLLSILLGAAAAMAIGMLWYSPLLFGKQWIKLSGFTPEQVAAGKAKNMNKTYTMAFLSAIAMSMGVHYFVQAVGALTFLEAAIVSTVAWVCFVSTTLFAAVLWESKHPMLFLLNSLHYLVSMLVMSLIAMWLS